MKKSQRKDCMNELKAGDRVKVKPLREIKKTLNEENRHKANGLYFNDEDRFQNMTDYCDDGKVYIIKGDALRGYELSGEPTWVWHKDWLEPDSSIQIYIDPSDPKSAHAAVSKACKEWKEKQRDWTEEEIKEAERLSDEIVLELFHAEKSPMFAYSGCGNTVSEVKMKFGTWVGTCGEAYCAKVHGKDVPNVTIGKCVCLCKATGRKIPKFILDKND